MSGASATWKGRGNENGGTLNPSVTRIEKNLEDLTAKVNALADAQIRTENVFVELRKEAAEREKRVDEGIEKLVSAIGELIHHRNGKTQKLHRPLLRASSVQRSLGP